MVKIDLLSEESLIRKHLLIKTINPIGGVVTMMPEKSRIVFKPEGKIITLIWNRRKFLILHFFLVHIIYGFLHLIHFAVASGMVNDIFAGVLHGFTAIMSLVACSIVLTDASGRDVLALSKNTIQ